MKISTPPWDLEILHHAVLDSETLQKPVCSSIIYRKNSPIFMMCKENIDPTERIDSQLKRFLQAITFLFPPSLITPSLT